MKLMLHNHTLNEPCSDMDTDSISVARIDISPDDEVIVHITVPPNDAEAKRLIEILGFTVENLSGAINEQVH